MDVRDLIQRVQRLTPKEKLHILNILHTHKISYSKNSNGYFFNLINADNGVLEKLHRCLELIEKNRDVIKEYDRRREELLAYYKELFNKKLDETISQRRNEYLDKLRLYKDFSNITMEITRLRVIPIKQSYSDDPDVLMRDFLKKQGKIPKTGVYSKILARIRNTRAQSKKADNKNSSSNGSKHNRDEGFDYETDAQEEIHEIGEDIDINDVDADADVVDEIDEVDDALDPENDEEELLEDVDEVYEEDNIILEEKSEDDEYIDDDKKEEDTSEDNTKIKEKLERYRKLLNTKGFLFDDDKHCQLVYQAYIP